MNLTIGQHAEISFAVNVMGTSADPTARVILETKPELCFHATRVGDRWAALVDLGDSVKPGSYGLRVEVVLNNRLFTPFKHLVEVEGAQVEVQPELPPVEVVEPVPEQVEQAEPPKETPKVKLDLKSIFGLTTPKKVEPVIEAPVAEQPTPPKKVTLPADFFKFTPKPVEKVEVKLPTLDETLSKVQSGIAKAGSKPLQKIKLGEATLVTLVRGEVIYE